MPPTKMVSMTVQGRGLELGAEVDVESAHKNKGPCEAEVEEVAHGRASRGRVEFMGQRPPTPMTDESKADP